MFNTQLLIDFLAGFTSFGVRECMRTTIKYGNQNMAWGIWFLNKAPPDVQRDNMIEINRKLKVTI